MSRLAVQLTMVLTFAVVLLLPRWASAVILPLCEDDGMSMAPMPSEPLCANAHLDDADGDSTVAALCDPRGATMIAPPRIHPLTDARIMAAHVCESSDLSPAFQRSSHNGRPSGDLAFYHLQATVDQNTTVVKSVLLTEVSFKPTTASPRPGIHRQVYRPPR